MFSRRLRFLSSTPRDDRPRELARGEKTVLREYERADLDRWMAWPSHRDPLFENYNPPQLTERQRDFYHSERRCDPQVRQYSVDDLRGQFVGRISLREIDWRHAHAVLGISFHPGRLNQGLGSDALRIFLGYYFGPLKMRTLFLDVAAFNTRAYRVYEKCGFRHAGQRWGDAQNDAAGIFQHPQYDEIRRFFIWDRGQVRPLIYDMVLRVQDWDRLQAGERSAPFSSTGIDERTPH